MKKLADQKRQEFMAWLTSHPHLADISKHIVVDFLNAHEAKSARICLIKDNNDLEVISEFGFDEKEAKLGIVTQTHEWQDRNDATFKVVAGISMDAWISDDMAYVCPLKVNNVNIDSLRIVISFSLYGNVHKYVDGLLENCKNINKIYPNFWIYVYLGNDFDHSILDNVFDDIKNLVFIETGKSGHEVMFYRFFSIDREEVGISFSRDLDIVYVGLRFVSN
jgi:hypothetical protein